MYNKTCDPKDRYPVSPVLLTTTVSFYLYKVDEDSWTNFTYSLLNKIIPVIPKLKIEKIELSSKGFPEVSYVYTKCSKISRTKEFHKTTETLHAFRIVPPFNTILWKDQL